MSYEQSEIKYQEACRVLTPKNLLKAVRQVAERMDASDRCRYFTEIAIIIEIQRATALAQLEEIEEALERR
ncbi:MAG: hypothetical protein ACK5OQ_16565 [Burkholderiales bacterium]